MSDQDDDAKKLDHKIDYLELIENKDAEIERLREENAHFAWRDADKNKLISLLCDALERWAKAFDDQADLKLSKRGKEATR